MQSIQSLLKQAITAAVVTNKFLGLVALSFFLVGMALISADFIYEFDSKSIYVLAMLLVGSTFGILLVAVKSYKTFEGKLVMLCVAGLTLLPVILKLI